MNYINNAPCPKCGTRHFPGSNAQKECQKQYSSRTTGASGYSSPMSDISLAGDHRDDLGELGNDSVARALLATTTTTDDPQQRFSSEMNVMFDIAQEPRSTPHVIRSGDGDNNTIMIPRRCFDGGDGERTVTIQCDHNGEREYREYTGYYDGDSDSYDYDPEEYEVVSPRINNPVVQVLAQGNGDQFDSAMKPLMESARDNHEEIISLPNGDTLSSIGYEKKESGKEFIVMKYQSGVNKDYYLVGSSPALDPDTGEEYDRHDLYDVQQIRFSEKTGYYDFNVKKPRR